MRPKKTFRDPRPKRTLRGGIRLHEDAELDAELVALIIFWREKYRRFKDRTFNPPMMDINVRIISESLMGSNLQIGLLAYARVDFAATRAQSFCTLEGITV